MWLQNKKKSWHSREFRTKWLRWLKEETFLLAFMIMQLLTWRRVHFSHQPHFNSESVLGKNVGVGPMYDGQSPQGICLLTTRETSGWGHRTFQKWTTTAPLKLYKQPSTFRSWVPLLVWWQPVSLYPQKLNSIWCYKNKTLVSKFSHRI